MYVIIQEREALYIYWDMILRVGRVYRGRVVDDADASI
jgi:hypothetical protein